MGGIDGCILLGNELLIVLMLLLFQFSHLHFIQLVMVTVKELGSMLIHLTVTYKTSYPTWATWTGILFAIYLWKKISLTTSVLDILYGTVEPRLTVTSIGRSAFIMWSSANDRLMTRNTKLFNYNPATLVLQPATIRWPVYWVSTVCTCFVIILIKLMYNYVCDTMTVMTSCWCCRVV